MAGPPIVRRAREQDLPALVRLLAQLFSIEQDFTPDGARQARGLALMLEDPARRAVLVAEVDGAVAGMVTAQLVVSTAEGAPSAWIEDMVVDAPHRGAGVGALLLEEIAIWAEASGATRLQLLADADNARALDFYAREGFTRTQLVCWRRAGRLAPAGDAP